MVVCTGEMKMNPDDKLKATGARIVSYGAPVLPGNVLLSYLRWNTGYGTSGVCNVSQRQQYLIWFLQKLQRN